MKNVLVVPTNRETGVQKFLKAWKDLESWEIIVLEDGPEKTFNINVDHHLCWKDIDDDLKENNWIISKGDSGKRCYGFWKAYQLGADYIFTLDDDCYPCGDYGYFCKTHIQNMENQPKWTYTVPGLKTRGIPYQNQGTISTVVNMGLWKGIPDLDAPTSLVQPVMDFIPPTGTRIIPEGQYHPNCGMNLGFRRDVAVLMYFPLMGNNSPYHRFDDIWGGIVMKRICDHLSLKVSCGEPIISHEKASNYFKNLIHEAKGIHANESFWEVIDEIPLTKTTPKECVAELGSGLITHDDNYISQLGQALIIWSNLF